MTPITAWSFSRWELYDTCPLKFKLRHIDKIEEPAAPAMERGSRIHDEAEAYLAKDGPLTADLKKFESLFIEMKSLPGMEAEQKKLQWGFTNKWKPTGWFGAATWFRSILDAFIPYDDDTATGIDFKTGKKRDISAEQIETQALASMCRVPSLKSIEMRLQYLDTGEEIIAEFKASDVPALKAKWEKKVAPMFADRTFAPRPNYGCKWCAYNRHAGGQCKFS